MERKSAYQIDGIDEISIQKMHFKVTNHRPQYFAKDKEKVRAEIERKLFEVFQKYGCC